MELDNIILICEGSPVVEEYASTASKQVIILTSGFVYG